MRAICVVLLCLPMQSFADKYEECGFVMAWARQAMHIAHKIKLPSENWIIHEGGFAPDEYKAIIVIKQEAYDDIPALTRRVELACGQKEDS